MKLLPFMCLFLSLVLSQSGWAVRKSQSQAVEVAFVAEKTLSLEKVYPTYVRAKQHYIASITTSATVKQLFFTLGQQVKQGDILLKFDNPDLRLDLQYKKTQWQQAQQDLKRLTQLNKNNQKWVSNDKISQADTAVTLAKLAYQQAQEEIKKLTVTALFDGEIRQQWVQQGENVNANQALFELVNPKSTYFAAQIPLSIWSQVDKQQNVAVHIDKQTYHTKISAAILPQNTTAYIDLELQRLGDTPRLTIGSLGQLHIQQSLPKKLAVPLAAIRYGQNHTYVWQVEDNTVRQVTIKPDTYTHDWVTIDADLSQGQAVVVKGFLGLKQNTTVTMTNPAD